MDFVCFTESVGVCEEENMAHRVDNAACSLSLSFCVKSRQLL